MKANKNRTFALKAVGHLYKPFGDSRTCTYCQCRYPEHKDHAPALARLMARGSQAYREANIPLLLVPACAECNLSLSARPLDTLESRTVWLYKDAQKKLNAKRLSGEWTQGEINDLGSTLRSMVQVHTNRRDYLIDRLQGLSNTITHYDDEGWPTSVSVEDAGVAA
jgi:hypothetical protein